MHMGGGICWGRRCTAKPATNSIEIYIVADVASARTGSSSKGTCWSDQCPRVLSIGCKTPHSQHTTLEKRTNDLALHCALQHKS